MRGAELFAGCGGLALGMSRAGFKHALMVEFDADAVATVEFNKRRGLTHVSDWPIALQDVREVKWATHGKLAVITGGPPCQPFGIGGKKNGHYDERDMWSEAIRAVRESFPDGFIFENVRNLAGPKFREYLEWIVRYLERPQDERHAQETHAAHLARLLSSKTRQDYKVIWQVVNAADYGAPQVRFRVLIFGIKASLKIAPEILPSTHSRDRLLWDQYVTGEYWVRHGLKRRTRPLDERANARIAYLRSLKAPPQGLPWVTVRDALEGLGAPDGERNHVFQQGARVYAGHTGSLLDLPAKALKAGDHGVPGGENMMIRDDGSVRYFTLREAARLVGLPDDYLFPRSWTESMRQLGNAVPTQLSEAAARWFKRMLIAGSKPESSKTRARAA
jgi:DNA (cytosine-5)-methyltransferase 1